MIGTPAEVQRVRRLEKVVGCAAQLSDCAAEFLPEYPAALSEYLEALEKALEELFQDEKTLDGGERALCDRPQCERVRREKHAAMATARELLVLHGHGKVPIHARIYDLIVENPWLVGDIEGG